MDNLSQNKCPPPPDPLFFHQELTKAQVWFGDERKVDS